MMNRRKFITSIICGVAGLPLISQLPAAKRIKTDTISWYLTQEYNKIAKGTNRQPKYIYSGWALFEGFEGELQSIQRFTTQEVAAAGQPNLMFKATRYKPTNRLGPWDLKISFDRIPEYEA